MSISVLKKFVTLFMALVMASCIVCTVSADAQTEGERYSVNYNMASNILGKDEFGQDTIANRTFSYYSENYDTMAELIVDQATPEFLNSVAIWETANLIFEPEDAAQKAIDAKGYYMSVILSMLKVGYETDSTAKKVYDFADLSKPVVSIANSFADTYKYVTNLELSDFLAKSSYTADEIKGIKKAQKKFLEDNNYVATSDAADKILKALELITKPQEYIDKFIEYCMISEMSNEWRQIIINMYNCCDKTNIPLTEALETLLEVSKGWQAAAQQTFVDIAADTTAYAYSKLVGKLMDAIVAELPFVKGMMIGYAIGKEISNMLFSTDKIIESFYICRAFSEVMDLVRDSVYIAKTDFIDDPSLENAHFFTLHVDLLFQMFNIGNSYAMDMADAVYRSGISNFIVTCKERYDLLQEHYNETTRILNNQYKFITTQWINDLYGNDNDLYELFSDLMNGYYSKIYITDIEFFEESLEWGTEDEMLTGLMYTISPDKAVDEEVVFISSDNNVVAFDGFKTPVVIGAGECVVKVLPAADYYDDSIYDTISITVVEGHGADGVDFDDLTPIEPTVPDISDFTYTITDNEVTITGYSGTVPNVVIPDTIEGLPVTEIGSGAFMNNDTIVSVYVPDSVVAIYCMAFEKCTSLEKVTLPNNLKEITLGTFSDCTSLLNINIPESVTLIDSNAFKNCISLTVINIHNNVAKIGFNAFNGCINLKSITIPDSVTTIDYDAFMDCTSLECIVIPSSVTSIGANAFEGCTSLTAYYPQSTSIGSGCFDDCYAVYTYFTGSEVAELVDVNTSIKSFTIPETVLKYPVTSIGDYAFYKCADLISVTIPNSITSIGDHAFDTCTNLQSVNVPPSVKKLGYHSFYSCPNATVNYPIHAYSSISNSFGDCYALYSYDTEKKTAVLEDVIDSVVTYDVAETVMGYPVTEIGYHAFYLCKELSQVSIPDSVITVGDGAFKFCKSLTEIKLSDKTTTVGAQAFMCCEKLKTLFFPDSVISIGYDAFYDCTNATVIYPVKALVEFNWSLCRDVYSYNSDDGYATLVEVNVDDTTYDILENVMGYPVTLINNYCFEGCDSISSIVIPKTIISITNYAFYNCVNLTSITIPRNVLSIRNAFYGCPNLTIYGYSGSYAEKYAIANDIPFVALQPPAPTSVTATPDDGAVTLKWSAVDGATKYAVYSYLDGEYTLLSSVVTDTSYTASGLTNGTKYGFKLKAYAGAWSAASTMVYATPNVVNIVPQNLKAFPGDEVMYLSWDKVDSAERYAVYMTVNGEPTCIDSKIKSTSYTVTGLTNRTRYVFYVKAYANGQWSELSDSTFYVPLETTAPQNLVATAGDGEVTLKWTGIVLSRRYAVYIYEDGKYTLLDDNIRSTTYTVKGLENGKKYGFKVKAFVSYKFGEASKIAYATPVGNIVPQNVKAVAGNGQATITWDAVNGATKYAVYSYLDGEYTCLDSSTTTTSYTAAGLTNGTKYGFKVKAYVGKWSGASAMAYATPVVADIVPQNVRAVAGNCEATVKWDAVSGATRYAVYSYLDGQYTLLDSNIKTTSYTATDLTNGTKYGFKVKAYVGKWSAASNIAYTTPTTSTVPQGVKAVAGNGEVTVKWNEVAGAEKYAVYIYIDGKYTCLDSSITDLSYVAAELTNGTKYGFKVKACVNGKWSAASLISYATPAE